MTAYILRRLVYGVFVLVGVNVLTFALFFFVNSPDGMARAQLGAKRVTPEAVAKWKHERGYDKPLFLNEKDAGLGRVTETVFYEKSVRLFAFQFGSSPWTTISTAVPSGTSPNVARAASMMRSHRR